MKIEIKHKYLGIVLFEHECEDNTIKLTLSLAVEKNADLNGANLWNADLSGANLWNANLSDADLRNANLRNANLRNADLRNANLWNANLSDADLSDANLWNANLRNADLSDANLRNANLWNANLSDADLRNADLRNADLRNAIGNGIHIISAQVLSYKIVFTAEFMWIGCRKRPLKTWWKDSEKESDTFDDDKEWRAKNKRWIQGMVKNNLARPTAFNEE